MMKKQKCLHFSFKYTLVIFALNGLFAQQVTIPISSEAFTMLLQADGDKLLKTVYFEGSLANESEQATFSDMYYFKDNTIGFGNAHKPQY